MFVFFQLPFAYPQITTVSCGAIKTSGKVVENRIDRERMTRAAKTALVALEMGATSRAMSAAAQDTASRWSRDKGLEDMEDACLSG